MAAVFQFAHGDASTDLIIHLVPRDTPYTLSDTNITSKDFASMKFHTLEQSTPSAPDTAVVLVNGNSKLSVPSILFERVIIGNDNQTTNSLIAIQGSNLTFSQSTILLTSPRVKPDPASYFGLFAIVQSVVIIRDTTINFTSVTKIMQILYSNVKFLNVSMNANLTVQLAYIPIYIEQSNLTVETMAFRGFYKPCPVLTGPAAETWDATVIQMEKGTMTMKNVLFMPGEGPSMRLFLGTNTPSSVQNFTVMGTKIGNSILDFRMVANNSGRVDISGFYLRDNWLFLSNVTGSYPSGLISLEGSLNQLEPFVFSIDDIVIQNNTQMESSFPQVNIPVIYTFGNRKHSLSITNVVMLNNSLKHSFVTLASGLEQVRLENVTIKDSTCFAPLFLIQPLRANILELVNLNINGSSFYNTSLIELTGEYLEEGTDANDSDGNYLKVTNMRLTNNIFEQTGRLASEITSMIICYDFGIRIYDSLIANNDILNTRLLEIANTMVTVVIARSKFSNLLSHSSDRASLFYKKQMDYSDNYRFDFINSRFVPDFGSFILLNNTFEGYITLEDRELSSMLNVANFFIHGNNFSSYFGTNILFSVNDIVPCETKSFPMKILLSKDFTSIIDEFLTDPLLIELFSKAIFSNSEGRALVENIAAVFSFRENRFPNTLFKIDSLLQISSVAPNTLIDISENQFSNLSGSHASRYNEVIYLFELQVTSILYAASNTLEKTQLSLSFLKINEGIDNSTILLNERNNLTNSSNVTLLDLDTHSPMSVHLLENFVSGCSLELAPLIYLNFRENATHVVFAGNRFEYIMLYYEGFFQIGLIVITAQLNVTANVDFERNWVMENRLITRGVNPSVHGSKNALIYMLTVESAITIKNSTFLNNTGGTATYFLVLLSNTVRLTDITFQRQGRFGSPMTSIYIATQNLLIQNSFFNNNSAMSGGCLTLGALGSQDTPIQIDITNNTFSDNVAIQGGAIFIQNLGNYKLGGSIIGNTFANNLANSGGSIYIEQVYITNLVLSANTYFCYFPNYANADHIGGAIYIRNTYPRGAPLQDPLQITDSTITVRNNATLIKSMIDVVSIFKILMKNLTFIPLNRDLDYHATKTTLINIGNSMNAVLDTIDIKNFRSQYSLITIAVGGSVTIKSSNFSHNNFNQTGCLIDIASSQTYFALNDSILMNNSFSLGPNTLAFHSAICVNSDSAKVILNSSSFIKNYAASGAVLSVVTLPFTSSAMFGRLKTTIENCTFVENTATSLGGALAQTGGSFEINNSSFINNTASEKGGAIYLSAFTHVRITDSLFLQNSVKSRVVSTVYGGAVYIDIVMEDPSTQNRSLAIQNNKFFNNSATNEDSEGIGGGGAMFIEFHDVIPTDSQLFEALMSLSWGNEFIGNSADSGNELSTLPYSSTFGVYNFTKELNHCYQSPCKLSEQIRADHFHGFYLHVGFIDFYGQSLDIKRNIRPSSVAKMTLQITNQSQIYFDSNCSIGHCIINGNDATIRGLANQDVNLTFNVTSPGAAPFNFVLMTSIRPCQVGEINDTRQQICVPCGKGSYSLNISDKCCHSCPQFATCPGEAKIIAHEDYWKPSNMSTNIYPCNNTKVCNQELYGDGICALGYKGPYCLACDLEKGYAASNGDCGKCPSLLQGLTILISIQLAIFIIEIGYIWYFRRINKFLIVDNKYSKKSVARVSRGGYMTIMMYYLQILTILKGYPLLVSGFLTGLAHIFSPSETILFSSDCVFMQLGFSIDNLFYSKLVILGFLPFVKWFLIISFGFAKKFIYSSYRYKTFAVVATQCMILIEQPSMLFTLSSYFVCKSSDPLAPDQSQVPHYMRDAPYVTCYTDIYYQYRKSLVIPLLVAWGAIHPLCILLILVLNRKNMKTKGFSEKFGTLYAIYRSKCFYWNLVQFGQKLILIGFAQFSFLPLKTLGLTLFLILIGFVILVNTFKPYRSMDLYRTDILSSYVFIVTIFLAVYGYQEDALNRIISYVIILLNIAFILYIAIKVLHLLGFKRITRCLSALLATCLRRRSNSNFFFDENYHHRADSIHVDDMFSVNVKRDSRLNSKRPLLEKTSELVTNEGTVFKESLESTENTQIISTAKMSEEL